MTKPQMPEWAQHPDPSFVDKLERMRRRHAWGFDQRPLLLETGRGPAVLDIDTAIEWAERLAAAELT